MNKKFGFLSHFSCLKDGGFTALSLPYKRVRENLTSHYHAPFIYGLILLLLSFALLNNATANNSIQTSAELEQQRKLFTQAEKQLKKNQRGNYKKSLQKLTDYPLYPYLIYRDYRKRLAHLSEQQVQEFLSDYSDTPYANKLRHAWLDLSARKGEWQRFLTFYTPQKGAGMQCRYAHALIQTGDVAGGYAKIPPLWLSGKSQPRVCDPVFKRWINDGKLTKELVWQRIELAMAANRSSLAGYLKRFLNKTEQQTLNAWLQVHRKPHLTSHIKVLKKDTKLNRKIVLHAVKRMSRRQPEEAGKLLVYLEPRYRFGQKQKMEAYRKIGLSMAYKHKPRAYHWLSLVDDKYSDTAVAEWRVRSAIRQGDWAAVNRAITRLNTEEQLKPKWQYWQAYSYQQLNHLQLATEHLQTIADGRHFYGFLAADELDMPYQFGHQELQIDNKRRATIEQLGTIQRAHEFYRLKRYLEARREWYFFTRQANNQDKVIAAHIAKEWGWHDRAIITLAHTDQRDDLAIRFPVLYQQKVEKHANSVKLNTAYTYAVIRRESAFAVDARSPVGALGLMQIMPNTGRSVAKKLKIPYRSKNQLLQADTNLKLGTSYLQRMLNKYNQQPALASAAYNAGSHRVNAWLPQKQQMESARWIETIPFTETRDYVSSIMAYTAIYEHRLGTSPTRLSDKLPLVNSKP